MGWSVPKIWNGGDVWILGGGPSIVSQFKIPPDIVRGVMEKRLPMSAYSPYFKSIHDKHVIGINVAYKIGNWIDMVFFGDGKWFVKEKEELEQFPNLKVGSTSQCIKYLWCKYISRDNSKLGISSDSGKVCFNYNSGASAISIAANAGAKRIFLLGFDMQYVSGEKHFHREYSNGKPANLKRARSSFSLHLKGFPKIKEDADKRGIEIYNVCPNSAIKCLPKITLEEALKMSEEVSKQKQENNEIINKPQEIILPTIELKEQIHTDRRLTKNVKTLCFVNHYYNPQQKEGFKGGSTVNTTGRETIVHQALNALRNIPNCDVKVCGLKGFTVRGIEVDIDFTGIKPWNLVYESLNYMHNFVNEYDYFINIEDDILLKESILHNVIEFDTIHKIDEVFLPNRVEVEDGKFRFVDLRSGWKKDLPTIIFKSRILQIANNFHSAILILSTKKYKYGYEKLNPMFREVWWGGPMASAYAYFHIPFKLYRNSQLTEFHSVQHLDHWKCYDENDKNYPLVSQNKNRVKEIIKTVHKDKLSIEVKIPYGLNLDLAGAYNRAMESSYTDWVLLLDHDLYLSCNPHWFDMCMTVIQKVDDKVGLITCVTSKRNKDKTVQCSDIIVESSNIDDHVQAAHGVYMKYGITMRRVNTYKVAGFFMLIRKSAWERVKFRSVGKGVDLIDWDFCERLLKRGYQIFELPGLYAYHRRNVRKLDWGEPVLKDQNMEKPPIEFCEWIHYYMKYPYLDYPYGKLISKHHVKKLVEPIVNVAKEFAYFTSSEEIDNYDYNQLPESFVIKATHGSHMNIIVLNGIEQQSANQKKAKPFDVEDAKQRMKDWLVKRFADGGEIYYDEVEKGILIEEHLCKYYTDYEHKNGIVDYKAWCFHGRIECIVTANYNGTEVCFYDTEWNKQPYRTYSENYHPKLVDFPKPNNLSQIVDKIHRLLDLINNPPFVRVDLYNFGDTTFFGEFTHSPGRGNKPFISLNEKEPKNKYELKFGKAIVEDKLTIICFKWNHTVGIPLPAVERGIKYNASYVNKLYHSIERNLTMPHRFVCVTDESDGIECETYPLWDWGREYGRCFTRLKMFDPAMRKIFGKRVICIDLDTVITGNLDKIFSHEEDFIIHTYYPDSHNYQQKYNGSLFMMDTGSRPKVYTEFDGWKSIEAVKKAQDEKKVLGSDQGWINYILGDNEARFGEDDGIYHLRNIMKPPIYTGRTVGQLPDNACMVMFSGNQDPSMPMYIDKLDWVKKNWVL